ncbi:MAG TPA: hypothetical protein VFC43_03180, partial [Methanoregula sp.]|nr:hypothetical protein [Methanoregula sp.]
LTETMKRDVPSGTRPQRYTQILLFDNDSTTKTAVQHRVLDELACIKPDEMTPLQALAKIAELRNMLENREVSP